ncbi:hypothetical protein G9A89_010434 [Geosiphon pyriformis]|nr:hypothetical protein G9A89_010434 [Geosiphon pyriformis]
MLKFGLKFLVDRRSKEGKNAQGQVKPEIPAFEWQVSTHEGQSLGDSISEATTIITPPVDALLGTAEKRKSTILRNKNFSGAHLKRSLTQSEPGRIRLLNILESETACVKFREYLVSQYCEENLDFYMDVVRYRSMFDSPSSEKEISSLAIHVWAIYLDDDASSKPLNVPQEMVLSCRREIEGKRYFVDLFDKLQQHCFGLMLQDSLPKFTRNSLINSMEDYSSLSSSSSFSPSPSSSSTSFETSTTEQSSTQSFLSPSSFTANTDIGHSPRKSLSSGSLRLSFSALKSLSSSSEISFQSQLGKTSLAINAIERSKLQNNASFTSLSAVANQRISLVGNSISHITRRMLTRRRDSTCSISSQISIMSIAGISYSNSVKNKSSMPGTYPIGFSTPSSEKHDSGFLPSIEYDVSEEDEAFLNPSDQDSQSLQKLRRNISAPNLQSNNSQKAYVFMNSTSVNGRIGLFPPSAVCFNSYLVHKNLPPTPEHKSASIVG